MSVHHITLGWVVDQVASTLYASAQKLESGLAFVAERWWLVALADITIKAVTDGDLRWPRDLAEAINSGASVIWQKVSGRTHAQWENDVKRALKTWQAQGVLHMYRDEIERGYRSSTTTGQRAHAFRHIIEGVVGEGVSLSSWAQRVGEACGLTPSEVLTFRNFFLKGI